jgi:hypothetical protein
MASHLGLLRYPDLALGPGGMGRLRPAAHAGICGQGNYAVTACFWSLLVTWMLRGLAASWTGMVRVSTPAA